MPCPPGLGQRPHGIGSKGAALGVHCQRHRDVRSGAPPLSRHPHQRLVAQIFTQLQIGVLHTEHQVQFTALQATDQRRRHLATYVRPHLGKLRLKVAQHLGQAKLGVVLGHADVNAHLLIGQLHGVDRIGMQLEDLPRIDQKRLATRCQAHRATGALDQRRADDLFQALQTLANGRLGFVQTLGRRRKSVALDNRNKHFK